MRLTPGIIKEICNKLEEVKYGTVGISIYEGEISDIKIIDSGNRTRVKELLKADR